MENYKICEKKTGDSRNLKNYTDYRVQLLIYTAFKNPLSKSTEIKVPFSNSKVSGKDILPQLRDPAPPTLR